MYKQACPEHQESLSVTLLLAETMLSDADEGTQSGVATTEHSMESCDNQNSRGRGRKIEFKAILGFLKKLYNIWAFI